MLGRVYRFLVLWVVLIITIFYVSTKIQGDFDSNLKNNPSFYINEINATKRITKHVTNRLSTRKPKNGRTDVNKSTEEDISLIEDLIEDILEDIIEDRSVERDKLMTNDINSNPILNDVSVRKDVMNHTSAVEHKSAVINPINKKPNKSNETFTVKTIVAYSLKKLINLHDKIIDCDHIDEVVQEQVGNNEWNKIEDVYVYSVYLDTRLYPHRYIRIISLIEDFKITTKLYCHFTNKNTIKTVEVIYNKNWYDEWENSSLKPVLISCKIPDNYPAKYVSLSTQPCRLNNIKYKIIHYEITTNKSITICVKPLNYTTDISEKLIGWIEINKILGADLFHIFLWNIHENIRELLKFYENQGYVNVFKAKFIDSNQGLWLKRKYEVIFYMDCFYRNLHHSDYILPIDIDEVIVPRKVSNWRQLLKNPGNYTSYVVLNTYYVTNSMGIPYFSNKLRGGYSQIGRSEKSFLSTANTLTLYHHNVIETLHRGYRFLYRFRPDDAQLNHYKSDCNASILIDCKTLFKNKYYDDIIGKYKKRFDRSVSTIKKQLDIFRSKYFNL